MNKILVLMGIMLITSFVFAINIGVVFTPNQFLNADLDSYDFELTNEGWTVTDDAYVFTVSMVTVEKVLGINGDWNGSVLSVEKFIEYPYWKERYKNCRTGLTPYFRVIDAGILDDLNESINRTVADSSKAGCITQAKENIKSRVIADRENERVKLLKWQFDLNESLNSYDSEWVVPPLILNEELN